MKSMWVKLMVIILALSVPFAMGGCGAEDVPEPEPVESPVEPDVAEEFAWVVQDSGVSVALNDVFFIDEATGWAVGGDDRGVVIGTTDGGETWSELFSREVGVLNDVFFIDESTGWAVGSDEAQDTGNLGVANVLKTTDGGQTWERYDTNSLRMVEAVHFVDEQTGYCVAWASQVFKSTDGGETWGQVEHEFPSMSDHFEDVFFVGEDTGWAVGGVGKIMATADAGQTWAVQEFERDDGYSIFPKSVYFADTDSGWVAGSGIAATTDGGETWLLQDDGRFEDVHFLDAENGWAVGLGGRIKSTTDGGQTWTEEQTGDLAEGHLQGVHFVDPENGWAVGDDGRILHWGLSLSPSDTAE